MAGEDLTKAMENFSKSSQEDLDSEMEKFFQQEKQKKKIGFAVESQAQDSVKKPGDSTTESVKAEEVIETDEQRRDRILREAKENGYIADAEVRETTSASLEGLNDQAETALKQSQSEVEQQQVEAAQQQTESFEDKIAQEVEREQTQPEREQVQERQASERVENTQEVSSVAPEKDPVFERLEKTLNDSRSLYAETDYNDRKLMYQIRKKLNFRPKEGDTQATENIVQARMLYEKSLSDMKNYQLEKLQQSSLSGQVLEEKIKEIVTEYNYKEVVNFYDAKTEARMKALEGTDGKGALKKGWDKVNAKMTKAADWYNKKVPFGVKVALGLTSFVPGLGAVVLGKRMWGAAMMAAAGGMQMDKIAHALQQRADVKEQEKVIREIRKENNEIDFDKFNSIIDQKISNLDDKIVKQGNRSRLLKYIAVAGATFIGVSAFSGALDMAHADVSKGSGGIIGKLLEKQESNLGDSAKIDNSVYDAFKAKYSGIYSKLGLNEGVNHSNIPRPGNYDTFHSQYGVNGQTPLTDSLENRVQGQSLTKEALQHAAEKSGTHVFTIKEGSNFIETLSKNFDEIKGDVLTRHPEWSGLNKHQIISNLTKEFAKNQNEGHMPDYVQAGLKMRVENGEVILGTDKAWGWYEEVAVPQPKAPEIPSPADAGPPAPQVEIKAPSPEDVVTQPDPTQPQETPIPYNPEHDYQKLETEMNMEGAVKEWDQTYAENVDEAMRAGEPTYEQYEKIGVADQARKDITRVLSEMRAEDVPWQGVDNVQELLDKGAGSKQILKVSLDNLVQEYKDKKEYWGYIKKQPFTQAAFEGDPQAGKLKKGFTAVISQFKPIIGEKAVMPIFEKQETTGQWLARITRMALEKQAE